MTVAVSNTNLVDSFNTWRLNTNLAATVLSNNVVTVTRAGSAARGGTSRGDGHIKGTFSANDLRASTIRGGNTSSISNITITSNTTINARTLTVQANTEFTGNVNFTTASTDRIIMGDISRIRMTGGSSGQFIRRTATDTLTVTPMTLRQVSDLSSNSADIILSSSNTSFSEELNTPDLRFSAGTAGADKFRIYGDGSSTAGDSDLIMQLVSTDGDSNFKIATSTNTAVHTLSASGTAVHTGRVTSAGLTTSGTIIPSSDDAIDIGANGTEFNDLYIDGIANIDTLALSTTAGEGVSTSLVPTADGAVDLGGSSYEWKDLFIDGTAKIDTLTVDENATIAGTLGVTGDLTAVNLIATGNIDLGNATSDTITATARFDSDLVPSSDGARDLGADGLEWKDLYVDGVGYIDELSLGTSAGQGVSTTIVPKTDDSVSLGTATREWQNLFIDGTAKIDVLTVDENATVAGTLGVTGTTTVGTLNATAITASGTTALNGATVTTFTANSAVDLNSTLNVDGNATLNGLTVTTFTANGAVDLNSSLNVDGNSTLNGDVTLGNASEDTINITGTVAGTANFTNLNTTGDTNIGNQDSDTLTIAASVDSNILPTGTVNIGGNATADRWSTVYATNIVANNITLGTSGQNAGNSLTVHGPVTFTKAVSLSSGQTISAPTGSFTELTASTLANFTGNVDLGSDASDTVSVNGVVDTNIVPSGNNSKDLGSNANRWRHIYAHDITITDDFNIGDDLNVTGALDVDGGANINTLTVTGATSLVGDVDIDGAITRDGGTVLFDTDGTLNQASIATNAIASAKLANIVTGASVGSASAVPVITFNNKGQITAATTATVAGVTGLAVGSGASGKTFTISTADGSTFSATVGAGSITSTELDTISGLTAQEYGSATEVPVITVDAKGRITAASEVAVAGISSVAYTSANNNVRISTGDSKTHDLTIAPATASVKGVASFDSGDFDVSSGAVTLKNATTGAVLAIAGTANETDVSRSNGTVTVGLPQDVTIGRDLSITRNLSVTGDLSVSGTTTTFDSTVVTVKDPIMEIGDNSSDDNLDRGIKMMYNNGSSAKIAFMGYDDSASKFLMIPDATDTGSVISGTAGTLVANLEGNVTGNINGTVGAGTPATGAFTTIAASGAITASGGVTGNITGNITSSGSSSFATVDINGGAIDGTTIGASSAAAGSFTTINASGNITGALVGNVTGNITGDAGGNAATATKLITARTIGGASFDGSGNIDVKVKTTSEESSLSAHFLTFVPSSTSTNVQDLKEDSGLSYTPSSGLLLAAKLKASTDVTTNTIRNSTTNGAIVDYVGGATNAQFRGNANTASRWENARQITLTGAISATITGLDGSGNITAATTFGSGGGSGISTTDIGDAQITAQKLALNAVEEAKINNGAVTTNKINDDAVTSAKLNSTNNFEAVTSDVIRAGAVDETAIGTDAVSAAKLKSLSTLLIKNSSGSTVKTIHGAGA